MFVSLRFDIISDLDLCIHCFLIAGLSALYLLFARDDLYIFVFLECNIQWLPLTFTINSWLLSMAQKVDHDLPFLTILVPFLTTHLLYHILHFMEESLHALESVHFTHAFACEMCSLNFYPFLLFNIYYFFFCKSQPQDSLSYDTLPDPPFCRL